MERKRLHVRKSRHLDSHRQLSGHNWKNHSNSKLRQRLQHYNFPAGRDNVSRFFSILHSDRLRHLWQYMGRHKFNGLEHQCGRWGILER